MKPKMVRVSWVALVCVVLLALDATAADSWKKLGDRFVNHSGDRDEISVRLKDGRFNAIQLRVKHRAVHFREVKVHFANGEVQDVVMRRLIPAGGETRVIDLEGDEKRIIEKVVFWYNTRDRGRGRGQAEVELWGRG